MARGLSRSHPANPCAGVCFVDDVLRLQPANLAAPYMGDTPVYLATIKNDNPEVLKLLLEFKADPCSVRTGDGVFPLYHAAQNNYVETLKVLLDDGR